MSKMSRERQVAMSMERLKNFMMREFKILIPGDDIMAKKIIQALGTNTDSNIRMTTNMLLDVCKTYDKMMREGFPETPLAE